MQTSLAARLTLSSLIVLPVLLGFSAYALDRAFANSLRNAEQEALRAQLYAMLGAAEPTQHNLELPEVLAEPRFNRPLSGLFGLVVNSRGKILWQSDSTPAKLPEAQPPEKPGLENFIELTLNNERYFALVFDSLWEIDEKDFLFRFLVYHSQAPMLAEQANYRKALTFWLGGLAALLMLAQLLITRWGLQPLRVLAQELKRFQQGNNQKIAGEYPAEIAPVITNLNELLQGEQAQRQRYKNTLSDLAHSLKTPLAIIRAELEQKSASGEAIDEQVSRMAGIIQHQLQRATLKTSISIKEKTPLADTINRLCLAIGKVYREKTFQTSIQIADQLCFPGDESDALEIFGNLLENAFKYGKSFVQVSARIEKQMLVIDICDDGPGVAEDKKQTILARGARADTSLQGQGIGLAVVADILSSYRGQLDVSDANLPEAKGAKFTVSLPLE